MARLWAFFSDTRGATSIEYAMIGAGISILCIVGAGNIGTALKTKFIGPISGGLN